MQKFSVLLFSVLAVISSLVPSVAWAKSHQTEVDPEDIMDAAVESVAA